MLTGRTLLVDLLGVLGPVDRHGRGAANRGVVEGGGCRVEQDAVHVRFADDVAAVIDVGVTLVAAELGDDLRRVGHHDVDGPRLERLGAGVGVDDRLEGDLVEVGQTGPPVVGVGRGGEVAVGHPLLEDEGPGADRVGTFRRWWPPAWPGRTCRRTAPRCLRPGTGGTRPRGTSSSR